MRLTRWILVCVALFFCLILVAAAGSSFYFKFPSSFWERFLPLPEGEFCTVMIRPGVNARQISQAFYDQGALVGSPLQLARWMTRFRLDRSFTPGRYRVVRSAPWHLARQLRDQKPAFLKLTIVPGMDLFSLAELFPKPASHDEESEESLKSALLDNGNYPVELRKCLPGGEAFRIAFLYPETYFTVEGTPTELVQDASRAWWDHYGILIPHLDRQTLGDRAVVASMLQREALWDKEYATIAGVIQNRLNKRMPLQIDATVIYAWKLKGRRLTRVMNKDLTVDSPYNTYRYPGLPPTPICIPGAVAWSAALRPEKNTYYYYVAKKDGYHYFSRSYNEHLRMIKKARSEP